MPAGTRNPHMMIRKCILRMAFTSPPHAFVLFNTGQCLISNFVFQKSIKAFKGERELRECISLYHLRFMAGSRGNG